MRRLRSAIPCRVVRPPAGAKLNVPPGFEVKAFASGLAGPRLLRAAPNGDIFVAETGAGRIRVLRPGENGSAASQNEIFASGLRGPFGIAFYPADNPEWVYVGNTDSVVRFAYRDGDLKARGAPETIVAAASDRRQSHDARRSLLQGRLEDVRLGRLGVQ